MDLDLKDVVKIDEGCEPTIERVFREHMLDDFIKENRDLIADYVYDNAPTPEEYHDNGERLDADARRKYD